MNDISILSPLGRGGETHGGITSYVLSLSKALSRINFDVELISLYPKNISKLPITIDDKIRIRTISGTNKREAKKNLISYYKYNSPKCLLAAGQRFNEIAVNVSQALGSELPVYLSVHNSFRQKLHKSNIISRRYRQFKMHQTFKNADGVIAVSQGVAKEIIHYARVPSQKIHVIYNPVPIQDIINKAEEMIDHPWFFAGQPPVILGVGRLVPQKDFQTLIHAFSLLRKKRKCRLLILGEGPERQKLEKLKTKFGLTEDVSLPGFKNNPFKFMKHANMFVLSSAWEGLGLVLVEALACGTTVVSTNCFSGPAEILENGRYGYLVPIKDEYLMAEAMEKALDNKYTSAITAQALERFLPTKCARQYAQTLNLSMHY